MPSNKRQEAPRAAFFFCCLIAYSLLAPNAAHAYLDPASGSMILQITIGAIAGAALMVKMWWSKAMALFARVFSGARSSNENPHDDDG